MKWTALGLALASAACQEALVRPELVLYVDVDMPVSSQASESVSPDALFDSLRIEVLDENDALIEARIFSIASVEALPLAFSIPVDAVPGSKVTVHLIAFRAAFAEDGQLDGEPVLDPRAEVSVDRLVTLSLPTEGVVRRSVVLSGDCLGIPVSFGTHTTCLDGEQLSAGAGEGIGDGALLASAAGSWSLSRVGQCPEDGPAGAQCIPGGFSVLGDPLYLAYSELQRDALPLRPVWLSPFYMDQTEVTVGTLRALLESGYTGPLPLPKNQLDAQQKYCTWHTDSGDAMPLNCVSVELADAVCSARGGLLPSEAQWEYAARGRGKRSTFVWGESTPECCTSSIAFNVEGDCMPYGPEPVGSHLPSEACAGDESLDGVRDLNGSLTEVVRDTVAELSSDCWKSAGGSAVLHDWVCEGPGGRMARGASWYSLVGDAPLPIRRSFADQDPANGFRCVYPATSAGEEKAR